MTPENNVICVFWGDKYDIKYPNILYKMCKKNIHIPFDFYCLTDNEEQPFNTSIKTIKLPEPKLKTWWNKIHLYNPEIGIKGNILYLDLDVVILDSLDDFFKQYREDDFCVIRDFGQPTTTINTSVLRYNLKHHSHLFESYMKDRKNIDTLHGDQNMVTDLMFRHKQTQFLPDDWTYSFKWPDRGKPKKYEKYKPKEHPKKKNAKICVFHGHPNPDYAMKYESGEWIKDIWR